MPIEVTDINGGVINYRYFDEITDNIDVIEIDCSYKNLTSLPDNITSSMLFPNLTHFNCSNNKLKSLPDNMTSKMHFPNLIYFDCSRNSLTTLPCNMNSIFPNLIDFNCNNNKLTALHDNMNYPKMTHFNNCQILKVKFHIKQEML